MTTIEAVRELALGLPRSYEVLVRDRVKFRVGGIVYLSFSRDETLMGFAFPKEERVAAAGLLAMVTVAITWLSVALGLRAKSVEAASNLTMPLLLLVFMGSGFVPTDSMPAGLQAFAEYQPFTPIIETLRGLLMG